MEKTYKNEGGNILIRNTEGMTGACGMIEMLHLFDKNKSGCVIAYWEVRKSDGQDIAEFQSCMDRFATTKYSFDIMEAVRFGQKMADLLLEIIPS